MPNSGERRRQATRMLKIATAGGTGSRCNNSRKSMNALVRKKIVYINLRYELEILRSRGFLSLENFYFRRLGNHAHRFRSLHKYKRVLRNAQQNFTSLFYTCRKKTQTQSSRHHKFGSKIISKACNVSTENLIHSIIKVGLDHNFIRFCFDQSHT